MSYFYFSYSGNKRFEVKHILELVKINLNDYDKIVEPFCGSFAFSIYLYDVLKLDVDYILNDNDKQLINLLMDIKKNNSDKYFDFCQSKSKVDKDEFIKIISEKDNKLLNYFYYNKIYNIHKGMYPMSRECKANKTKKHIITDEFLKRPQTYITNNDFKETLEKYKDDEKALLFLDPPYIGTCNSSYNDLYDNCADYIVFIVEYLKDCKCKVILSYNFCKIINYLFKDYNIIKYNHKYQTTKNKNVHCIITNIFS